MGFGIKIASLFLEKVSAILKKSVKHIKVIEDGWTFIRPKGSIWPESEIITKGINIS